MTFSCYRNTKCHRPYEEGEDGYIPEGYEEFETMPSNHNNNNQQQTQNNNNGTGKSLPIYYIMELQNTLAAATTIGSGATTTTLLEEIAMVWKDTSSLIAPSSSSSSTPLSGDDPSGAGAAQGIKIKVISSVSWRGMIQKEKYDNPAAGTVDLSWVFSWLEQVPPLRLPQPVGSGWGTSPSSSLMVIVAFDPDSLPQPSDDHHATSTLSARRQRLLQQIERSIAEGHMIMKFKQDACSRNYPIDSQISLLHFSMARKVQIVRHSISEEETIQKLLAASLMNAERFVPEMKRQQWDLIPSTLLMVLPHPLLPYNLAKWLRDPVMRRSEYDLSLANVLLHLDCWQNYTPPSCYCVEREMLTVIWHHIGLVQSRLAENVASVKAGTAVLAHSQQQQHAAAGGFAAVDAKALYDFCTDMARLPAHAPDTGLAGVDARKRYNNESVILRAYMERMLAALQTERLRCYEDMKKHDLYSVQWKGHCIEIPPPNIPKFWCSGCGVVRGKGPSVCCAYHSAASYFEAEMGRKPPPGKPIPIRSKNLLEKLPFLFSIMNPGDNIVVKIHVSGVREDYPLISTGDLVRLQFHCPGAVHLTTEVIGEVADVTVKTEEVTLRLPPPFGTLDGKTKQVRGCTQGCFPYLQALLHTKDFILDARPMLAYKLPPSAFTGQATEISAVHRKEILDRTRFDVRFGFQGGRGFDIIRAALVRAIATIDARRGELPNDKYVNPASRGKTSMLKDEATATIAARRDRELSNLCRVLAPSEIFVNPASCGMTSMLKDEFDFALPINDQQRKAVFDIVNNIHGR